MANQDLQNLYKMRDALKREEFVKSYNSTITKNHQAAAQNRVVNYTRAKNEAYNKYQSVKESHSHGSDRDKFINNLCITIIPFVIGFVLSVIISSNVARSLMHLFCTWVWGFALAMIGCVNIESGNAYKKKTVYTYLCFFIASLLGAIITASMCGVSGFWRWFGAFWLLVVWPIANFFFIGPVRWLSIISFLVAIFAGSFVITNSQKTEDDKNTDAFNAENNAEVKQAKAAYDRACAEYNTAYNAEYAKLSGEYKKLMRADNYSQDKRALASVIPANLQTLDMVNKLIWCIENRYADTIVQARNWYLQQEQNAAMMNQLNGVAKKLGDIEKIQKEAAAEAAMAHQAILGAINNQTSAINKQTSDINKQMDKLNKTAKENAEANQKTAYYADKIHHEIKY